MSPLESIVLNTASGVAVALALEWLRSRYPAPAPLTNQRLGRIEAGRRPASSRATGLGKVLARVALALLIGFFLSAFIAGFIESETDRYGSIGFGEPLMMWLMALSTALAWFVLARLFRQA
jgi:hypothetical protein